MHTSVINENDITPEIDAKLKTVLIECFPHNTEQFTAGRRWRGNRPVYNVILHDNDDVCGQISVIDRTISVNGNPVRCAGIANVGITSLYRGKKLSDIMLKEAIDHAEKLEFDIGMLFTHKPIDKIYCKSSWKYISERKYKRIENGFETPLPETSILMYYPLKIQNFPDGDVDLNGDKW